MGICSYSFKVIQSLCTFKSFFIHTDNIFKLPTQFIFHSYYCVAVETVIHIPKSDGKDRKEWVYAVTHLK